MTIKLKPAIFIILAFIFSLNKLAAQTTLQNEYYIEIKNVNNKALAREVEALVKSKPSVSFFSGYKIPVAFHLLKTTKKINKAEFADWLKPLGLEVIVFEERALTAKFIMSKKRGKNINGKGDISTRKK
jgi:hypothetical protein